MLMHLAEQKGITINHAYLEPGHTHMEADSIHYLIEKGNKRCGNGVVEVPRDWLTVVRHISARKRLAVTQMVSSDFKNSKLLFEGPLVNRQ